MSWVFFYFPSSVRCGVVWFVKFKKGQVWCGVVWFFWIGVRCGVVWFGKFRNTPGVVWCGLAKYFEKSVVWCGISNAQLCREHHVECLKKKVSKIENDIKKGLGLPSDLANARSALDRLALALEKSLPRKSLTKSQDGSLAHVVMMGIWDGFLGFTGGSGLQNGLLGSWGT
jgi:hypothetical protein